ncbi:MAG: FumA C-terminus/TtdB family hydratase beta subunit [Planctomycetota bacterium]|jgi:fumarate hydratase class I|nr:FumA C-terminus/TtdB family hydratase beta subunit [Planctomycetota bacterium]
MTELKVPCDEAAIRELKCGDFVEITGVIVTGRDAAHTFLLEEDREVYRKLLDGTVIYHCGPVVKKDNGEWRFLSAGPTTSAREEPYQYDVIKNYGLRGVIGKGGMGPKTLKACEEFGAVYLHALGGAGALAAARVKKVHDVKMLDEFGVPEAFWVIEVEKFPVIVTMDSHGKNLHDDIRENSEKAYKTLLERE